MRKGFTLIELLVVIAIIGILVSIGAVTINNAKEKNRKCIEYSSTNGHCLQYDQEESQND